MRLLQVDTLELREFPFNEVPSYAILSHRWETEETTFVEMQRKFPVDMRRKGHKKIHGFAEYVKTSLPHIKWIWIDTCCIDKTYRNEMVEAIVSMYEWYSRAEVCVAYLTDVSSIDDLDAFERSLWFRRGWTLQEFIAPRTVVFVTHSWQVIGHKGQTGRCRRGIDLDSGPGLTSTLATMTGIPAEVLDDPQKYQSFSIHERLQWAEGRRTARVEDMSYSLLGLFNVAITPSYGEGRRNARLRLLESIHSAMPRYTRPQPSISEVDLHADKYDVHNNDVNDVLLERPRSLLAPFSNIPFERSSYFVDRPALSEEIGTTLARPGGRAVLIGPSGIGKSELTIEYARQLQARSPQTSIFWIDATNRPCFNRSVYNIMKELKVFSMVGGLGGDYLLLLSTWLRAEFSGRWLVLLDNVNDLSILLEPPKHLGRSELRPKKRRINYFPICDHGSVIITMRDQKEALSLIDQTHVIEILPMKEGEAEALLMSKLGRASPDDLELVRRLGYMPSDISLAATVIQDREQTVRQYCDSLQATEDMDDVVSLASVESDFTASTLDGTAITADLIEQLVKTSFCSGNLISLYTAASRDPAIGLERFQRNLGRLIANLGTDLSLEATNKDEDVVSRLLRSRTGSSYAAISAVEQALENEHVDSQQHAATDALEHWSRILHNDYVINLTLGQQIDNDEYEEADEYMEADDPFNDTANRLIDSFDAARRLRDSLRSLRPFISQSKAYSKFCLCLLELVLAPHEKRIKAALGHNLISEEGRTLDDQTTTDIVTELSFTPFNQFQILSDVHLGTLDMVKANLEDVMGEHWEWWPLGPRKQALPRGYKRLRWTFPDGEQSHVGFVDHQEQSLVQALSDAPPFLSIPQYDTNNNSARASKISAGSGSSHFSTTPGGNAPVNQLLAGSSAQVSLPLGPISKILAAETGTPHSHRVYLCVRRGDDYEFPSIKVLPTTLDKMFFVDLREKYLRCRGFMRNWFSVFRYHHCKFYQLQSHEVGSGEPVQVDFPAPTNTEYDYDPKPIKPYPPIGPRQFNRYFYNPHRPLNFHLSCWRNFQIHRLLRSLTQRSIIQRMPKKRHEVHLDCGQSEIFWGLLAVERRSPRYLLAYCFLCNSPSIVFFFMWLFQWGHAVDLQDGAIPIQISLTLTLGFLGFVYGTREEERH